MLPVAVIGYLLIVVGVVVLLAGLCVLLVFFIHGRIDVVVVFFLSGIGITAAGFVCVAISDREKMPKPGTCRHCGYDLRGGHEKCPECGTSV